MSDPRTPASHGFPGRQRAGRRLTGPGRAAPVDPHRRHADRVGAHRIATVIHSMAMTGKDPERACRR
jgi:hypothetical protein